MKVSLEIEPIYLIDRNIAPKITGFLYKMLDNDKGLHNSRSLFSISTIQGQSEINKEGLISYKKGGKIFLGAHDPGILEKILINIQKNPNITKDIKISAICMEETPKFKESHILNVRSQIWLYRDFYDENKVKVKRTYYTYKDKEANETLNYNARNKLKDAGLESCELELKFNTDYPNKSVPPLFHYKDSKKHLKIKGSFCPVIATGDREAIEFLWNVGLGCGTAMTLGNVK